MKFTKSLSVLLMLLSLSMAGCEAHSNGLISYNGNYIGDDEVSFPVPGNEAHAEVAATNPAASEAAETESASAETSESDGYIYVSILGEVTSPGVYVMPKESRIYELINVAGGATGNADTSRLNLVSKLEDGMQIIVPGTLLNSGAGTADFNAQGAAGPGTAGLVMKDGEESFGGRGASLININTASVSELTALTGIGKTRAEAIVKYRESVGGFKKCEDLMSVSGIKQGIYDKLKDEICVE